MLKVKKPTKSFFFTDNEEADKMFEKSLVVAEKFSRQIGCGVFSKTFTTKTILFCALVIDLISYLIISVYNIYLFRNDFIRSTFCVVTLGMGFQGAIKLYTFVFHRSDILKLCDLIVVFQQSV